MVQRKAVDRLLLKAKVQERQRLLPALDAAGTRILDVLRNCPGCGNEALPRVWRDNLIGAFSIECADCGWHGDEGMSLHDAVDAWNSNTKKRHHRPFKAVKDNA